MLTKYMMIMFQQRLPTVYYKWQIVVYSILSKDVEIIHSDAIFYNPLLDKKKEHRR